MSDLEERGSLQVGGRRVKEEEEVKVVTHEAFLGSRGRSNHELKCQGFRSGGRRPGRPRRERATASLRGNHMAASALEGVRVPTEKHVSASQAPSKPEPSWV